MCPSTVHRVPPAPEVMAHLYADYLRQKGRKKQSFGKYLKSIGFTDPTASLEGGDSAPAERRARGAELVSVPQQQVQGPLRIIVLLADFPDLPGTRSASEYGDMLFSNGSFQTGSMRDFYAEASCGKVQIEGSVHGWFRMPHKYSYYVNNKSGTGPYPRNAQRLAEDVVKAAMAKGVAFAPSLDKLGDGSITGLFIVHAGRGAEVMTRRADQLANIWSHKADMVKPVRVSGTLTAQTYLTVPEDCRMGVCAHELGHLAFGWDDFYDPNYDEDGSEWDGAGVWDLMAGGSWNNGGLTPAHPAGLHKSQHGWVQVKDVSATRRRVKIPPYTGQQGTVVRVHGPKFSPTQCLLLENRRRAGFDRALPGEGLLVWRVDTSLEMVNAIEPAMLLVEADGRHDLENPNDRDAGDPGDPFPGAAGHVALGDTGDTSTSFPGRRSGIRLSKITVATNGTVTLDIEIAAA